MIGISRTTCLTKDIPSGTARPSMHIQDERDRVASRSNSRPAALFAAPATSYPSDASSSCSDRWADRFSAIPRLAAGCASLGPHHHADVTWCVSWPRLDPDAVVERIVGCDQFGLATLHDRQAILIIGICGVLGAQFSYPPMLPPLAGQQVARRDFSTPSTARPGSYFGEIIVKCVVYPFPPKRYRNTL